MYYIKKTAKISRAGERLIVGLGSTQIVDDGNQETLYSEILSIISSGAPGDSITRWMKVSAKNREIFQNLERAQIIGRRDKETLPDEEFGFKSGLYLDATLNNSAKARSFFGNTTFVVAGCGGIGNYMAYALASLPTRRMILVDGDVVEVTNLNRQFLFGRSDVGHYKSRCLRKKLKELNPILSIEAVAKFCDEETLTSIVKQVGRNSFVVLSADSAGLLQKLVPVMVRAGIPFLNVGYLNDISVVGPFWIDSRDPCPLCNNFLAIEGPESNRRSGGSKRSIGDYFSSYEAPSCMMNNAVAGSLAMAEILRLASGDSQPISRGSRIGVNCQTFDRYDVPVPKDPNCPYCSGLGNDGVGGLSYAR